MNEVLLRRLIGILVLLLTALALSFVLPRPGLVEPADDGTRLVTVDLSEPDSEPVEVPQPGLLEATESPALGREPEDALQATPSGEEMAAPGDPEPVQAEALESEAVAIEAIPAGPPITPESPVAAPETPPKPAPAPAPKPAAPTKPVEAVKPAKSASPPAVAGTTPPASGASTWYVQVGAYGSLENAEDVRGQMSALGVSSLISPADTAGGPLYRVRSGPYARAQADAIRERLVRSRLPANVVAK